MTGTITKTILAASMGLGCMFQLAANSLLDPEVVWGIRQVEQGKGTIERNSSNNNYLIKKDTDVGMIFLVTEQPVQLETGICYEVSAKFKTGGAAKGMILFTTQSAKGDNLRNFQTLPVSSDNKVVLQKKSFVAREGETQVTIVIVLAGGVGAVEVEAVDFQEKTQAKE